MAFDLSHPPHVIDLVTRTEQFVREVVLPI
ncbi:MAG: hypothetical protein JWO46_1635, partial [Nocardioidaceae bacterium]|nr:hypothetical protein [Nocardioidaceae bacterium]